MSKEHSFVVFRPKPEDLHLTLIPGCFARLRMFDPHWQMQQGLSRGDRLVCLDLDAIVTGSLDSLFDRDDAFVILRGANSVNPCPYNGSVMMLRCGEHADVWSTFTVNASRKIRYHEFPDDQGWIWDKIPGVSGWKVGSASGIYAFQKPGWPSDDALPRDARLVVFPGWRDPSKFESRHSWIGQFWRR